MTLRACLRVAERLMVGIRRTGIIRAVAIDAIGRERGKLIVHVTIQAGNPAMCACERKLRIVVRESRRLPRDSCMTRPAVRVELRELVVRQRCCLKLRLMTRKAVRRCIGKRSGLMAQGARCHNVRPGQWKGCCGMVEA
jgi:hypothetical protein